MLMRLVPLLRCPWCEAQTLTADAPVPSADRLTDGAIRCGTCRKESPVVGGVWHAMGPYKPQRTLAQLSNVVPPTPQLYEKLWRHRSLSLLSRGRTSTAMELQELHDAFAPAGDPGRIIVDVACSEGLYARELSGTVGVTVIAIDHSVAFLKRLHDRAGALPIVAVRALAQHLPLAAGVVDGVVMGGSLNEIGDETGAVAEMARITKTGGTVFSMSLVRAATKSGRFAQALARLGGVRFPKLQETLDLFTRAGFDLEAPRNDGVVLRVTGRRK